MKNKDLKECLALLEALHSNSNLKPEQKDQIGIIIRQVKTLGRKRDPSRAEVFLCVKEVTKRLLRVLSQGN